MSTSKSDIKDFMDSLVWLTVHMLLIVTLPLWIAPYVGICLWQNGWKMPESWL